MVRTRQALPIAATAVALLVVSLHGQQPPAPAQPPARPGVTSRASASKAASN